MFEQDFQIEMKQKIFERLAMRTLFFAFILIKAIPPYLTFFLLCRLSTNVHDNALIHPTNETQYPLLLDEYND
jgi:hypothetical protein